MFDRLILDQLRWVDMLEEEVPAEEPEKLLQAPGGMSSGWNAKDLIELLEGLALGLGNEEQHAKEADDVPPGVPAERARGREGLQERGPRDCEHEVEEPRGGGGQGHALGTDVEGVRFGGVCEWDGAFAGGVDDAEEVQAEGDAGDVGGAGIGNQEREAGEEEA